MAGRKLSAEEIEEAIRLALALDYEEPERRPLLMEGLPKGAVADITAAPRRGDQLRHDLRYLNNCPGLRGVVGPPLAIWLRNAVRMATSTCRIEAEGLERLLAVVEGRGGATAPSDDPVAIRLRDLIRDVLAAEPVLRARLADRLTAAADATALADHLMSLTVEALIDPLLDLAYESESLCASARRLTAVVLPAATDWRAFRKARAAGSAGRVHLEVPFLTGPLCEIVVAAAQDRPAQLDDPDQRPAQVPAPALAMVGMRDKPIAEIIARNILEKVRRRREEIPSNPKTLIEKALEAIAFRRDRLPPGKRYQMYMVFQHADDGSLKSIDGSLPDLWLVRSTATDDSQTLLDTLNMIFGWTS